MGDLNYTQPRYNTIVGVPDNFHVSCPNHVISRVKYKGYIGKEVLNSHLGSKPDQCYIQNCVIMNHVMKRLRCSLFTVLVIFKENYDNIKQNLMRIMI